MKRHYFPTVGPPDHKTAAETEKDLFLPTLLTLFIKGRAVNSLLAVADSQDQTVGQFFVLFMQG